MNTDDVLTLTQWLSPGFPVGAFAYSHGLEAVIEQGKISSAADLEIWLSDIIAHGSGRADAILLAEAYRADKADRSDNIARAFAASSERLLETDLQGAAFTKTVEAIWKTQMGSNTYPVAVGRAAKAQSIELALTAQMYLHAFAANLVSAAVRLVPLGQTEGQEVLARLKPLIQQVASEAIGATLDDLSSSCFAADIAAMQHETQYSKVFRT